MQVAELAAKLGIEPPLAALLLQRGVKTPEAANEFFNPRFENLLNPYLMKDMEVAISRIQYAIDNKQRVMIYGDYDVDGTTSVALLMNFFSQWLDKMMFYIPDRYAEGYGISRKGIDYAADNDVKLIITVDCGIKAVAEIAYASEHGVDFIVCDHHLPDAELPAAIAVLDPKREDCDYPYKELSGCGLAFKIAQAYCIFAKIDVETIRYLLDLVVVSIAADIVPLNGENRILAHFGLVQLNSKEANKGLAAIVKICGLEGHKIAVEDIIFKIGPRINATGRMEIDIDPDDSRAQSGGRNAVRLMTAPTKDRAIDLVNKIEEFNKKRKEADRLITAEARRIIEVDKTQVGKKSTIIYKPEWMKGVVGIVASRLIETYYRPTVVLTESNGFITGSARSVPGFDLYGAVEACSDLLENFGGHTYAVGLTMKPENLDKFCVRFEKYVADNISDDKLVQNIEIDLTININDITPKLRREIELFAPFGPGNSAPVFASIAVRDNGHARRVGAGAEHLKMEIVQQCGSKVSNAISAIAFSLSDHYPHIASGGSVDICYTLADNHFQGIITPQLRIRDIRPAEF